MFSRRRERRRKKKITSPTSYINMKMRNLFIDRKQKSGGKGWVGKFNIKLKGL